MALLIVHSKIAGQSITYAGHVQPIIFRNCAIPCHHPGGVGPFSLLTYLDVAKRGKFVAKVTQVRYMPPFPADKTFQHYANERGLTDAEISTIQVWVKGGMKEGSKGGTDAGRNTSKGGSLSGISSVPEPRKPDLVLRMKPYAIPATGREDFRYFHIPMHLSEDVWVEAIEFVPGNRKLLHHSRLMIDSTGTMAAIDGMAEDDPRLATFQKTPLADEFLYGWVPGNDQVVFPAGTAKRIRAGSDLLLNIHYTASFKVAQDQSEVRLYFAKTPVKQAVRTISLTENSISNQPFTLLANTKPTFYMTYGPLPDTVRLLSVLPHMHKLGQTIKAFAITPDGGVINLIRIADWAYNWQLTYFFRENMVLPKGSVIIAEAQYDNTDQNPLNPNSPPKTVGYGWNSTNEMMNLVFYYVK